MNTVWVLGDQLSPEHAALAVADPAQTCVLMVESKARGLVHRYHQIKLALVYSAMRHFAAELRARGWRVDYYPLDEALTFEEAARRHVEKHRPENFVLAEPNSHFESDAITKLGRKLRVPFEFVPTTQFLLPRCDFAAWAKDSRHLMMENHYRRMRKRFGFLIQKNGDPEGGAWNFDAENRQTFTAWKKAGRPLAKTVAVEMPDEISREVITMVEREFPDHPGRAADLWLPVNRAGGVKSACLICFFFWNPLPCPLGVSSLWWVIGQPSTSGKVRHTRCAVPAPLTRLSCHPQHAAQFANWPRKAAMNI